MTIVWVVGQGLGEDDGSVTCVVSTPEKAEERIMLAILDAFPGVTFAKRVYGDGSFDWSDPPEHRHTYSAEPFEIDGEGQ